IAVACATGSRKKAGSPTYLHVDPAFLESIMPPPLAWLRPFLPYAPPFDLNVNDLCALGPADFGLLDAAQLFALLKGEPLDKRIAAIAIITQIAATLLWQQV